MAYQALFRAWGADYAGGDACRSAAVLDLRCRTARGGLGELRDLNRPAVLQLRDALGQEFQATLTRLDDRSATLVVGEQARTFALAALAAQWSGHYTVLWRIPPEAGEITRLGQRGPEVQWLSRQLSTWLGRKDEAAADVVYDDALVGAVKRFQLAQGLVPDGLVGPQTLLRLSGIADPAAPRLVREGR